MSIDPWSEGYLDGRAPSTPEPGPNRDPRYAHSWRVGRAEIEGRPIPAAVSRAAAAAIEAEMEAKDVR